MSPKPCLWLGFSLILLFFILSIFVNTHSYLSWDVSWLLEASRRLLAGGSYSQNFMENNPPLILFLYAIPVTLSSYFGGLVSQLFIFTYAIAGLSLSLSYLLLKRLMSKDNSSLALFLMGLAFCYFILVSYEFAQREHLMLMLIMPYLLLVAVNAGTQQRVIPKYLRCSAGIMAGVGFAIKPYFLIPLILILSWEIYRLRRLGKCLKIENIALFLVMLSYLIACLIITPDYFSFILPLSFKFYFSNKTPLSTLLVHSFSVLFYITSLLSILLLRKKNYAYHNLILVLLLSNFGFFLVCLIQGHFWYYHLFPMASLSTLLLLFSSHFSFGELKSAKSFSLSACISMLLALFCLYFLLNFVVDRDLHSFNRKSSAMSSTRQIIEVVKKINQGPFMAFSTHMEPNASLLSYTKLHSSSRLYQFWMLLGISKLEKEGALEEATKAKHMLADIVIQDLLRDPPTIIVVEESATEFDPQNTQSNYLNFLLKDPRFAKIWSSYHLKTKLVGIEADYAVYTKQDNHSHRLQRE